MFFISFTPLLLAVPVLALPNVKHQCCNLSNTTLLLPSNQTALAAPIGAPSFVAVAVGVQNYTCNATALTYS